VEAEKPKTRRQFFRFVGAAVVIGSGLVITSESLKSRGKKIVEKITIKLPKPTTSLPQFPADPASHVTGLSKLVTPNVDFFQIDNNAQSPQIDVKSWVLSITGMVKKPIHLSYEQLLNRPLFELDNTISCVSNPVGGTLAGNARWLGCSLDDLIREAGPVSTADQVLGSSVDGFSAGFPLSALDGRGAMIAVGMNGEPLPIKHGYPARIIVPGLYGYVSATKWLTNIEVTRFDKKQGFWISRGWSALGPIKMESRIDFPRDGSTIPIGDFKIVGVAWAPPVGVSEVQVSIDGDWKNATLGPSLSGTSWRQWWIDWTPSIGQHKIQVRAIDANGVVQTSTVTNVAPDGASGWHSISVTVQK
jgi:DMSO/TMAO reductase YedYZ molybdopterin-dependent catalytic subunit